MGASEGRYQVVLFFLICTVCDGMYVTHWCLWRHVRFWGSKPLIPSVKRITVYVRPVTASFILHSWFARCCSLVSRVLFRLQFVVHMCSLHISH